MLWTLSAWDTGSEPERQSDSLLVDKTSMNCSSSVFQSDTDVHANTHARLHPGTHSSNLLVLKSVCLSLGRNRISFVTSFLLDPLFNQQRVLSECLCCVFFSSSWWHRPRVTNFHPIRRYDLSEVGGACGAQWGHHTVWGMEHAFNFPSVYLFAITYLSQTQSWSLSFFFSPIHIFVFILLIFISITNFLQLDTDHCVVVFLL